jgi:hypothetical protein
MVSEIHINEIIMYEVIQVADNEIYLIDTLESRSEAEEVAEEFKRECEREEIGDE